MSNSLKDQLLGLGFKPPPVAPKPVAKPAEARPQGGRPAPQGERAPQGKGAHHGKPRATGQGAPRPRQGAPRPGHCSHSRSFLACRCIVGIRSMAPAAHPQPSSSE